MTDDFYLQKIPKSNPFFFFFFSFLWVRDSGACWVTNPAPIEQDFFFVLFFFVGTGLTSNHVFWVKGNTCCVGFDFANRAW